VRVINFRIIIIIIIIISVQKNGWTDLSNLYINMACFCARSCLLGVMMITPALNLFVALIFYSN